MKYLLLHYRRHYIEYLSGRIFRSKLETLAILRTDDLETLVRRAGKRLPPRPYGSPVQDFHKAMLKVNKYPPFQLDSVKRLSPPKP